MSRDILENLPLNPYKNADGKTIEITHVEIAYYKPTDDNKHTIILPVADANEYANQQGIYNPFVSAIYDKSAMMNNNKEQSD